MTFNDYIDKIKTYLCCNMTEEQHRKEFIVCYEYSEEQIYQHIDYFKNCYNNELSSNKALLFFYDYLIELKYASI